MKIKEYDPGFDVNEHRKEMDEKTHLLLQGGTFIATDLNRILKYLGYDNEEVICGRDCTGCPFYFQHFQYNSGYTCSAASSNYVRHLISLKRDPLEDML